MIKPLETYVVLELEKEERTTSSGIILTSESKEKSAIGRVVAIGPKVTGIKVGERVVYETYSGTKVKLGEVERLLVKEEHVLGIIE
ncbi:MAG TPA: molecular chaperone GroES [Firmicutes bacterium]|nr:molecular chaperone GroES [Bacillota bacterium]